MQKCLLVDSMDNYQENPFEKDFTEATNPLPEDEEKPNNKYIQKSQSPISGRERNRTKFGKKFGLTIVTEVKNYLPQQGSPHQLRQIKL
ncbi:hypothetical protein TNCT_33661 [Trichonephila clavata]|uniref:Uncharacterized protein n=1 Tax=Trichonephila clavata TaxID=2740835 RepID=A0A8X6L2E5_TRICU|nr:hypothetical protein TNCT_33661 [Trichonephila clavata]